MASPWTTRHRRRAQWEELVTARFVVGDVRKVLASLPDQSVDLVFSSPPFLGLRSYLPPDHPNKSLEIGSEATPADYIDTLLDVVEDCARLLAPHGSLAFELGDTYATSLNQRKAADNDGALWNGAPPGVGRSAAGAGEVWPLPKSLCGIPELFAFSLAYGRNLLRPERTTEPWRVRNLIAWTRPNPPVGALGDKVRPATSYITVAAKSAARWWDMDAVRSTPTTAPQRRLSQGTKATTAAGGIKANSYNPHTLTDEVVYEGNPAGAPLLDWWPVPTKPYRGAHYATFPDELARRAILLMCPLRVCTLCGEPSRRVTKKSEEYAAARATVDDFKGSHDKATGLNGTVQHVGGKQHELAKRPEVGFDRVGPGAVGGREALVEQHRLLDVSQGAEQFAHAHVHAGPLCFSHHEPGGHQGEHAITSGSHPRRRGTHLPFTSLRPYRSCTHIVLVSLY